MSQPETNDKRFKGGEIAMSEVIAKVTTIDNGRIEGELIGKLVRCKDCKHGMEYGNGTKCEFDGYEYPDDFYCGYGER